VIGAGTGLFEPSPTADPQLGSAPMDPAQTGFAPAPPALEVQAPSAAVDPGSDWASAQAEPEVVYVDAPTRSRGDDEEHEHRRGGHHDDDHRGHDDDD